MDKTLTVKDLIGKLACYPLDMPIYRWAVGEYKPIKSAVQETLHDQGGVPGVKKVFGGAYPEGAFEAVTLE